MKEYIKNYFKTINELVTNYGDYFGLGVSIICLFLALIFPETISSNNLYILFVGMALLFGWSIRSGNPGTTSTVVIVYLLGELMIYAVAFDTTVSNLDVIYKRLPDTLSTVSSIIWWSIIVSGVLGYLDAFENSEEDESA